MYSTGQQDTMKATFLGTLESVRDGDRVGIALALNRSIAKRLGHLCHPNGQHDGTPHRSQPVP